MVITSSQKRNCNCYIQTTPRDLYK